MPAASRGRWRFGPESDIDGGVSRTPRQRMPKDFAERSAHWPERRTARVRRSAAGVGGVVLSIAVVVAVAPPAAHGAPEIRYDVVASADAGELRVEVVLPRGLGDTLTVDPEAARFVDDVTRLEGEDWQAVPRGPGGWRVPGCGPSGCRLRYVFHLRAAARSIDDPDTAAARGEALVSPASTWLLRPTAMPAGNLRGRLHVAVPPPLVFVTGLPRLSGVEGTSTYTVTLLPSFVSPYSAFGRFDEQRLDAGGAELELAIAAPILGPDIPRIRTWVLAASQAVTEYFARFPVARALVLVVPWSSGVHGKAMGGGGATVLLQMAPGAELTDPAIDWQAAHEMVHLAVPELARAQIWLSEGLATYIEPIARSLTGELRAESVWRDLVIGLPKGLPGPGDRGLDRTHTWGRTYWGGALFAFVADLEIRQATHGARSLRTAVRGVLAAGGDARVSWTVQQYLAAADHAVGQPILAHLYQRLAERPGKVDLPALWRALGVSINGGRVELDDSAPLAAIRRQMIGTAP